MRGCENEMTEKPSSHQSVCRNESRFGKIGISREGWTLEGFFSRLIDTFGSQSYNDI